MDATELELRRWIKRLEERVEKLEERTEPISYHEIFVKTSLFSYEVKVWFNQFDKLDACEHFIHHELQRIATKTTGIVSPVVLARDILLIEPVTTVEILGNIRCGLVFYKNRTKPVQ